MFGYATFFPINRCPVSVITFWIKEAQNGGIEGHTRTLERALGGCPKRHFRTARRSLGHRGGLPCHNALLESQLYCHFSFKLAKIHIQHIFFIYPFICVAVIKLYTVQAEKKVLSCFLS